MDINTMKILKLFTIGYEGREIDDFIARLKSNNINRLIDVREIAISRKKGFSKSALQAKLESENIEYVHIPSLGSPSAVRRKLKQDSDYKHFFSSYREHLSNNLTGIEEATQYIHGGLSCIMCFERHPEYCHRSTVALTIKELSVSDLNIIHI